ncbi:hypothetical protein J1614_001258 [Plenodomus biglobosus]|nr:hypothetical protein J1614_001258 [Plenodomus biglobosus]
MGAGNLGEGNTAEAVDMGMDRERCGVCDLRRTHGMSLRYNEYLIHDSHPLLLTTHTLPIHTALPECISSHSHAHTYQPDISPSHPILSRDRKYMAHASSNHLIPKTTDHRSQITAIPSSYMTNSNSPPQDVSAFQRPR